MGQKFNWFMKINPVFCIWYRHLYFLIKLENKRLKEDILETLTAITHEYLKTMLAFEVIIFGISFRFCLTQEFQSQNKENNN